MSYMNGWELSMLKKLLSAILKKVGPVSITNEELNKASGDWTVAPDGWGIKTGCRYTAK